MKRIICILFILTLFFNASTIFAYSTSITVGNITAQNGETVTVPVTLSGNSGIAGAVIKISYDSRLTLTGVAKGSALSGLSFTPPAKMTSNPITLLWDGIEADSTNGVIANLTFTVPSDGEGLFSVNASYDVGGIYDNNLNDVDVVITNGGVTVIPEENHNVDIHSMYVSGSSIFNISLYSPDVISGKVLVGLYDDKETLIDIKIYQAEENITVSMDKINIANHAKIVWWKDLSRIIPVCPIQQMSIK